MEPRVLRPDGPSRVNPFSSVPGPRDRASALRARHCVRESVAPCIPRVRLPPDRDRSELVPDFRPRDRFAPGVGRVRPRAGRVSATFPEVLKKAR